MRTIPAVILALVGMVSIAACSAVPDPSALADPLEPTQEELFLLSGMRLDLTGLCTPRRVDLADGALAGVDCSPNGDAVDKATLYLFNSEADLLAAYQSRLATHGVPLQTNAGRCLVGQPSEGAYTPEDGGGLVSSEVAATSMRPGARTTRRPCHRSCSSRSTVLPGTSRRWSDSRGSATRTSRAARRSGEARAGQPGEVNRTSTARRPARSRAPRPCVAEGARPVAAWIHPRSLLSRSDCPVRHNQ